MKTSTVILTVFAVFIACSASVLADEPAKAQHSLSLYIVSKEKIEGWKFIDSPKFPKLGYISPAPDLVISKLKNVETFTARSILTTTDTDGQVKTTRRETPAFKITLLEEDAPGFTAFSRRAWKQRVLIMLGDHPLIAPRMFSVLTEPTLNLEMGDAVDDKNIKAAIMKLVK